MQANARKNLEVMAWNDLQKHGKGEFLQGELKPLNRWERRQVERARPLRARRSQGRKER